MPEVTEQPAKPRRTWLPMAAWTLGILAALGLAYLIGSVVIVFRRVDSVLRDWDPHSDVEWEPSERKSLGEPKRALRDLGIYLAVPGPAATQRYAATKVAAMYGSEAAPLLLRLTRDRMPEVRSQAVWQLRRHVTEKKEIMPAMIRALGDADVSVRRAAAEGLSRTAAGGPSRRRPDLLGQAVPALGCALRDPDAKVRRSAVEALHWTRSAGVLETVPELIAALKNADPDVRAVSAWDLASPGKFEAEAIAALEGALSDPDANVRRAAVETLKKIKGEEPPK